MGETTFSLAGDFPPMDAEQWRPLAEAALKGAPLEKLVKRVGGLSIEPLYTRPETPADPGWPGEAPFVRGTRAARRGWDVRQVYSHPDLAVANRALLDDLARGVTSVELRFDGACRAGADLQSADLVGDGLPINRVEDLQLVLANVLDDLAPISLSAGASGAAAAALAFATWRQRGRDSETYAGQMNIDPIDAWVSDDTGELGLDTAQRLLADVARYAQEEWPLVRTARVDGSRYHDAGSTDADELASVLATGVAYIETLTQAGLTVAEAARHIVLRVALDADLFASIAKLRAVRQTWGRVLSAAGAAEAVKTVVVEATTSRAMMTRRDPWVNMLRMTVACFAGGVGGADVLHVRPFDEAIGLPDDLSLRIARNTQTILMDESHLAQVIDPGGGAWFVESLTAAMADAAWTQFQTIQREGGIASALTSGLIQDRIDATWTDRKGAIARRRSPITGVSEFPNLGESTLPDRQPPLEPILRAARTRLAAQPAPDAVEWPSGAPGESTAHAVRAAEAGATIAQIMGAWTGSDDAARARPSRRLTAHPRAAAFEALRDASDRRLESNGRRPPVLLVKLGPVAEHTARATYARNFFEAGGIEAVDATPLADASGVAAAVEAQPGVPLAVICGTDERYGQDAAAVAQALKTAGLKRVYLAGRPGEREADLTQAGVDEFIFIGVNVLEALERAHATVNEA